MKNRKVITITAVTLALLATCGATGYKYRNNIKNSILSVVDKDGKKGGTAQEEKEEKDPEKDFTPIVPAAKTPEERRQNIAEMHAALLMQNKDIWYKEDKNTLYAMTDLDYNSAPEILSAKKDEKTGKYVYTGKELYGDELADLRFTLSADSMPDLCVDSMPGFMSLEDGSRNYFVMQNAPGTDVKSSMLFTMKKWGYDLKFDTVGSISTTDGSSYFYGDAEGNTLTEDEYTKLLKKTADNSEKNNVELSWQALAGSDEDNYKKLVASYMTWLESMDKNGEDAENTYTSSPVEK